VIIAAGCVLAFIAISGLLIRHGRRGRRGLIWMMRMHDDDESLPGRDLLPVGRGLFD
jgi:hypothetical protein